MKHWTIFNSIILKSSSIFELLPPKNQSLLTGWYTLFVLYFGFDRLNSVSRKTSDMNFFSGQGFKNYFEFRFVIFNTLCNQLIFIFNLLMNNLVILFKLKFLIVVKFDWIFIDLYFHSTLQLECTDFLINFNCITFAIELDIDYFIKITKFRNFMIQSFVRANMFARVTHYVFLVQGFFSFHWVFLLVKLFQDVQNFWVHDGHTDVDCLVLFTLWLDFKAKLVHLIGNF